MFKETVFSSRKKRARVLETKRVNENEKKKQKGRYCMKNIYLYYKGQYYDVGTVVKIQTRWNGVKEATFRGWSPYGCSFLDDGIADKCYWFDTERYIVEIVKPIHPQNIISQSDDRIKPPSWDVETGWIWYIIVMVGGAIFNDAYVIWIIATVVFFGWKNGFMNGGNK